MEFARGVEFPEPLTKLSFGAPPVEAFSGQFDVLRGGQVFVANEFRRTKVPAAFRVAAGVPCASVGEPPGEVRAAADFLLESPYGLADPTG